MLSFLACITAVAISPLSLAAGLFLAFLFFKEWNQLAWGLLLFVVPGMGGANDPTGTHGFFYMATTQFVAVCLITFVAFHGLEYLAHRRRSAKSEL